ncbi:putative gustatory receptor 58c [Drosophila nasuta]|uniref:putative gustatory receptor 58c n=1 Tax=Drosophila nasuta TaxID=42062 RepID=UPI00295F1C6E|nr:putative gustatory receptor 58c [Drosophila nasuta]
MVLILVLFRLSRAVGLCNFRYVPETGRFKRGKGPMQIYYILLHVIYVLLAPCCLIMLLHSQYECEKLNMLAAAYNIVSIAKGVSTLMLICGFWVFNTQWLHTINGFMLFQQIYQRQLMHSRFMSWWKIVMTFSRFVLLFKQLFGQTSVFWCDKFDGWRAQFDPLYVVLSLAIFHMELVLIFASYWMYFLITLSNRVIGCMSLEIQKLRQDFNWLSHRQGNHRNIYEKQLYFNWHKLWSRCMQLDRLTQYLLHFGQWQILLNLFSCYLSEITIIFNIVIYSTESDNFHLARLMAYVLLGILFHSDFMSYFAIFGINRLQWSHLLASMEELWFTLGASDFDPITDNYYIALHRQISLAIIVINRRQHRRQDRVRRLQIAGLFDMNPGTGYRMTINIVMNVVVLWQIAYKYYY